MTYLSLDPVSAAIYARLNVSGLTALIDGKTIVISDDPAQGTRFPFIWYEVQEDQARGFGTRNLPRCELRVHIYSDYEGMLEAQRIAQKVIELLGDHALTVSGYDMCDRIFYERTVPLPDEELNGVKVHELVPTFYFWVEEPA